MNYSIEKFEDYLRGEMSETELASFEIELSLNPEMDANFQEYKMIRQNVGSRMKTQKGETALKETLTKLGDQYFKNPQEEKTRFRYYKLLKYAAIFLVFISATGLLYNQFVDRTLSPQALADKYYQQPTLTYERGLSSTSPEGKALSDAYERNDLTLLDKLLATDDKTNQNIRVILAARHYQKGEYDLSYNIWEGIADQGKGRYEDMAIWYMTINQLQLGNQKLALQNLEFFNNKKSSYYYEYAQELMETLQRQNN